MPASSKIASRSEPQSRAARDKENMPPPRSFGLSSSSSASAPRHRRGASDDEEQDNSYDHDDSYRGGIKKASSKMPTKAVSRSEGVASSSASSRSKRPAAERDFEEEELRLLKKPSTSSGRTHNTAIRATDEDDFIDEEDEGDDDGLADELVLERKAYDSWIEKKLSKLTSKREQMLEDRLSRIKEERDEIQSQYDELRQLRNTAPERALEEFKKTAETRFRHDKDQISSLKVRVEAAERRARELSASATGGAGGSEGADRSMSILNASIRESVQPTASPDNKKLEEMERQHKREMTEAARNQKKLEEEVKQYKLQLEQEVAHSKALLASGPASTSNNRGGVGAGATRSGSDISASIAAMEDEKAVRKLYEDLTGLVVTGVEKIDAAEKFRRFKCIFAQEDYYSLLMDLEESTSQVQVEQTRTGAAGSKQKVVLRNDIVYVPKLDEDRDRELLDDEAVPPEWLEVIRFDRAMFFKWYDKARKILLTQEARQARAEREAQRRRR